MQRGEDDKNETTRQTIKPDTNTDATREERDVLENCWVKSEVAKKDEEHPIASSTNIDNYTEGEQITNANDEDDPARNDGKSIDQTDQEKNSGVDARESRAPLTQQDGAVKGDGKSADNDNQDQNSGMNAHSNPDPLTQLIDYEENTEEIPFEFDDLNNTQKQAIADIGRFVQNALEKKVVEVTSKVIVEEIELPEVAEILAYVRKCVTFCWSARRHDPPVYIDFMEVTDDTLLDLNVYKPYTKKGKLVDYVVWPPIYLHKGGPMLSKGVAQGKNKN
ncbi:uncharacterized protein LOC128226505 isoform X2 [Mya arenaria]|uniref:uncharacterized protein LOC128226505 isoform X2 n=1 Tax=Mya arenaria TaxID=6604 RepID=UPI0022E2F1CA|nr:uncharacterized protein LOC128226505 isoform X2 [Mya arenaria]